jgi:hypothetical protein
LDLVENKNKFVDSLDIIYPPEVYEAAESILATGNGILEVNSIDKGVYQIFVNDDDIYEVEVSKPFTKKMMTTCVCDFHKANGYCKHTVAALIHLRQETKNTKPSNTKPVKLKLADLLDEVPHDELVKFIKYFAGKDRKLNIALKVHFAKYADLENNAEKYKAILDSVIKPVTVKNQKLSQSDWSTFKAICSDLLDQTEDLIVIKGAEEAVDILNAVIGKLAYIQNAFGKNTLELLAILKSYHIVLSSLITDKTSLDLLDKIKEVLLKLIDTSYYSCSIPEYNAAELLWKHKFISDDELKEIIKTRLKGNQNEHEIFLLHSLNIRIQKNEIDFSTIPSAHIVYLEKIVDDLILNKELDLALKLLYFFHNNKGRNPLTLKLAKILIDHNDAAKLSELAELFISTKDLRIIDYITQYHKDFINSVTKEIEQSQNYLEFQKSIAFPYYLAKIYDYDRLLEHLTYVKSFELLKNFDKEINNIRPVPLALLYTNMVDDYLKSHLGEASNIFVDQLLLHLSQIKAPQAIKHIRHLINDNYKHRFGLLEVKM